MSCMFCMSLDNLEIELKCVFSSLGLSISLRGLWPLEWARSAQMMKFHLNGICVFIVRYVCAIVLVFRLIIDFFFRNCYCCFTFLPPSIFLSCHFTKYISPLSHFHSQMCCYLVFATLLLSSTEIVTVFYFWDMKSHLKSLVRKCLWEKTCGIYLSVTGLLHQYDLVVLAWPQTVL